MSTGSSICSTNQGVLITDVDVLSDTWHGSTRSVSRTMTGCIHAQAHELEADLSKPVKLIQRALKKMPYYIAFHGRHIVKLDCDRSLKSFQPHIYFVETLHSDILYQICCLQSTPTMFFHTNVHGVHRGTDFMCYLKCVSTNISTKTCIMGTETANVPA